MLKRFWSFLLIEVELARVLTGFLLGFGLICFGFLLVVGISAVLTPSSLGLQVKQDVSAILFFMAIGLPIGFLALNGPTIAIALFLASIWVVFVKRLRLVILACCFVVAALGVYAVNTFLGANFNGSAVDPNAATVWTQCLKAVPFIVASVHLWFDPKYRKKNEL